MFYYLVRVPLLLFGLMCLFFFLASIFVRPQNRYDKIIKLLCLCLGVASLYGAGFVSSKVCKLEKEKAVKKQRIELVQSSADCS